MRPIKVVASLAAVAWAVLTVSAEPRTLTAVGVALFAGAATLVTIAGVLLTNRWIVAAGGVVALATLAFVAPSGRLALAMGLAAVVAYDAVAEERHLARYRDRLPRATLQQAVTAHARNLVAPLLTLAIVLALVGASPYALAAMLGTGARDAVEIEGAVALVVPGLLVLFLPLVVGVLRQRG